MTTKRLVLGAQAFFFAAGVNLTTGDDSGSPAGRALKPEAADAAWFHLGTSDWTFTNTGTTEDHMAPSPGARVLYEQVTLTKGLKLTGALKQLSNLTWRLLLSTATMPNSPTAGGNFVPLAGEPKVEGWLKLQLYDVNNVLVNTLDLYVSMKIPGDVAAGAQPVDATVEANLLFSTLNSGTLA